MDCIVTWIENCMGICSLMPKICNIIGSIISTGISCVTYIDPIFARINDLIFSAK